MIDISSLTEGFPSETQEANADVDMDQLKADLMAALWHRGIDVSRIPLDQLDSLVRTIANNSLVKDAFGSSELSDSQLETLIDHQLFDPGQSTDAGLVTTGIGLLQSQGHPLSAAQQDFASSNRDTVPAPFDQSAITGYGYGFMDPDSDFASGHHEGTDFDVAENTPVYAPFAGTIQALPSDGGYGNFLILTLDNGWSMRLGHLNSFAVTTGQRVNPGELLALSGNTGNSTGPHIHFEWRDPQGNAHDPSELLGPIWKGTTYAQLGLSSAMGSGVSTTSARDRLLGIDPILEAKYPDAVSAFEKYFGRRPTAGELMAVARAGNAKQQEDYVRSLASHIPGVTIGQYTDTRGVADQASMDIFGHPSTDAIVKEMIDRGLTTKIGAEFFYEQMAIKGQISSQDYNSIWQAAAPHLQALYNEHGFDPRIASAIHQQAQGKPPAAPPPPPPSQPVDPNMEAAAEAAGGLPFFGEGQGAGGALASDQ